MKRSYGDDEKLKEVDFFVGVEVEHTPQRNAWTLFVVGLQPLDKILELAKTYNCVHVYLGANQSFNVEDMVKWTELVRRIIEHSNLWVSLDFDVKEIEQVYRSGICTYRRFIPMISVKIPNAQYLGYNAVVKIDDIGFDATNSGVWCHRLHSLQSPETFTGWDEYKGDKELNGLPDPATSASNS